MTSPYREPVYKCPECGEDAECAECGATLPKMEPAPMSNDAGRQYLRHLYAVAFLGMCVGAAITWKVLPHQPAPPEECHDTAVQVGDRVLWTSNSCPTGTNGELKGEGTYYATLFCKCRKK